MQQLSMMHQLALIFIDGFFLYYIARSFVKKLGQNSKSKKIILIGVVAAIFMSSHYVLFNNYVKSENYLEFYRIQRAYSSETLFKKARQVLSMYHPDKNKDVSQDQFSDVMMKRNVLADQQYQKLYDRFGEFQFDEQTKAKDYIQTKNSLALNAYINTFSFYAVFFIVSVVLSYGQKYTKYRILSILILLGFGIQDIFFFSEIDDEYDTTKSNQRNPKFEVQRNFYDDYFPTYTIFERLQLIRILCAALLTSLRLYFDCLTDEPVNKYEDSLDEQIDLLYERLMKQTEVFRQNTNTPPPQEGEKRVFDSKSFNDNKDILLKIKELSFKHKEEAPKDRLKWLKKLFKFAVFGLFIYSVFGHLLDGDSGKQKPQKPQKQQSNHQHQHNYDQNEDF